MLAGHPFGISVGDYTADGHGLVMVPGSARNRSRETILE
jgi:hypothetical protein